MLDITYRIYKLNTGLVFYKLSMDNSCAYGNFLIIQLTNPDHDYLSMYHKYVDSDNVIRKATRIRDIEEVSLLHNAFFQLLIKNIDAVKVRDVFDGGLVINRQCFYNYIFPYMQQI